MGNPLNGPVGHHNGASHGSTVSVTRVLITGNDAVGEGALRAGCTSYFGYPITPQNELTAFMAQHMPKRGRVFIQAESEIASINMVFGAAAAGQRSMTSSSSPGISLMQEGISYLAAAELPAVIVNVQRGGPGLGNIAPAQGDYFQATRGGGHGDYRQIVLAPDSVQEMHDLTILGFELADLYRTPVMLLADGRLGQMMEPIVLYEGAPPEEPNKPWALTGAKGRARNYIRSLYLSEEELEALNLRLQEKYRLIAEQEIRCEERMTKDCEILIVGYGTCSRIGKGVTDRARSIGLKVGLFRPITLWPFPYERLAESARGARAVLAIEMSSGQMLEDVRLAIGGAKPVFFEGRMGGVVPSVEAVLRRAQDILSKGAPMVKR